VRNELQRISAQPRHDLTGDASRDLQRSATPPRGVPPVGGRGGSTGSAPTVPSATGPAARRSSPVTTGRSPTPVSGYQPVRPGRAAGAPVRPDRTPPATVRPRQQPNREFEQKSTPSMIVVGGLLLLAFVVGLVLWVTMGSDDPQGFVPATSSPVDAAPATQGDSFQPANAAAIVEVRTFDPDGDGNERDDLVSMATDGQLETAWTTVCYSSKFLGGKQGVGLVADLGTARTGTFTVTLGSGPYQLKLYGTANSETPTSFSGWGQPVGSFNGLEPATVSVTLTEPTRFVLVSFNELAPDPACTDNPYRGAINEFTFT